MEGKRVKAALSPENYLPIAILLFLVVKQLQTSPGKTAAETIPSINSSTP